MTRSVPLNQSAKKPDVKLFYHLVAGTVFFTTKDDPETPHSLPVNAILTTTHGQITEGVLSRANQGLAQSALDKVGPEAGMQIHDIQPLAFTKLGHMLPSEFHDLTGVPVKGA